MKTLEAGGTCTGQGGLAWQGENDTPQSLELWPSGDRVGVRGGGKGGGGQLELPWGGLQLNQGVGIREGDPRPPPNPDHFSPFALPPVVSLTDVLM